MIIYLYYNFPHFPCCYRRDIATQSKVKFMVTFGTSVFKQLKCINKMANKGAFLNS